MKVELPLTIVLPGRPYVKKNTQRTGANGFRFNSHGYNTWHRNAQIVMRSLGFDVGFSSRRKKLKKLGQDVSGMKGLIDYPINLQCRFYVPTNNVLDMSALYEGVQDLLAECGVIDDDNWHIVAGHDGSRVEKDKDNPRVEITITNLQPYPLVIDPNSLNVIPARISNLL